MADQTKTSSLGKTLLNVAWLSILLGLFMQLLMLIVAAYFKNEPALETIVADLVQKVSWSTLVCSGVAVGMAAGKMRPQAMGIAGLIAAPVAFYTAKVLHKSASQALAIAGQTAVGGPSPLLIVGLKALEYALLGLLIGLLGKKPTSTLAQHALAGLAIGLVFGGTIVYLMVTMAPEPIPALGIASRCINEIIFPVGCAIVLFAAQKLGEKTAETSKNDEKYERELAHDE
ncbi:MAG: hypothetical protein KJ017_09840 [Alphaproteobacteria bacterium]|nr:hypothetical protein [Alphaproteobacteria bacterium]